MLQHHLRWIDWQEEINVSIKTQNIQENMSDKICVKWDNPNYCEQGAFQIFRKYNEFSDVTLAFEDGPQLEAHKVILAACTPFFREILKRSKDGHPIVYMRGVRSEDMVAIVDFLYCGEANISQQNLESFLRLADDLKIKGLGGEHNEIEKYNKPSVRQTTHPDYDGEEMGKIRAAKNVNLGNPAQEQQRNILVNCQSQNAIRNCSPQVRRENEETNVSTSAKNRNSDMDIHGDLVGQSWDAIRCWEEKAPSSENVMKIPREGMAMLGRSPKWDSLTLVSCNLCGKNVKIEAFEFHMTKKHKTNSEMFPATSSQTHKSQIISATSIKIIYGNKSK